MGADTGITVLSTTNYSGVGGSGIIKPNTFKIDIFTRDGQTNLVCDTRTQDGAMVVRIQSFYHDGLRIGYSITMPEVQDYVTEPGSPFSLSFRTRSPNGNGYVYVRAKDGSYVDIFTCTNGVYYPADSHMIAEIDNAAKQATQRMRDLNK
jgi:hypothetical protein